MPSSESQPAQKQPLIIHFVTGGFSGATRVAASLVAADVAQGRTSLLVLRKKRQTTRAQLAGLEQQNIPFVTVPGWAHWITIWCLYRLCLRLQPGVFVAHGFSEHLWGRLAARWARVPRLIHVEHNSRERYTPWRLAMARWLAKSTHWIVGVSEGVKTSLLARGFPAEKCVFINNGIDLAPFAALRLGDFTARIPGLVMCARFARQKDHATLLQGLALLKAQRGLTPPVVLLGGGKPRLAARMRRLCQALGLDEQVEFAGHCANVPEVLARYQVAALITHYEGMPLALVEAMAAGCALLGSDVVGVHELLAGRELGLLVPPQNPQAVADALFALFSQPAQSAAMAARAREYAFAHLGMAPMLQQYAALYSADSP